MSILNFITLLKGLLENFFRKKLDLIIRPSYFPFTTMSFEIDVIIKGISYEIGGAGIMHRKVLGQKNYTNIWPAIGFGLERLIMVKYGFEKIEDCYSFI